MFGRLFLRPRSIVMGLRPEKSYRKKEGMLYFDSVFAVYNVVAVLPESFQASACICRCVSMARDHAREENNFMSKSEQFYLRQNIQIEPLVDQWYAWPHLIPPATAARNITERHLKIMDSYISGPQIHAKAVKNPKMLGGPFIDYGGKRVDEIRELRERIKTERAHLLELSAALNALDAMLRENAKGHSLQPLYPKVPEILRGYVELVYDLNNHPSFRLVEPLLYRSIYYDTSAQSLMLSVISEDDRPFVLSTPRLE